MTKPNGRPHGGARKVDIRDRVVAVKLYEPHPGQLRLHRSTARFRIVCCGRRWGKTMSAANEIMRFCWKWPTWNGEPTMTWWVAPTYQQTRKAFNVCTTMFEGAIKHKRQAIGQMEITWHNGSVTQFMSAERYENLRGEGVAFMVLDEAAFIARGAWQQVLRPMLSDTGGSALMISTPKGKNWFYALYKRGLDPLWPDYEAFSFPTVSSPYVPASEVEEARQTLPEDVFAQEYLGEFLDEAAGVFHGIEECVFGDFAEPAPRHRYVIGWDIAKHTDWSVITVIDVDAHREGDDIVPHVAHWERFNTLNYVAQIDRVAAIAAKYGTYVLLDSTGLGDPIYDMMCVRGIPCYPYTFTSRSKQQIIQNLAVGIQARALTYPQIDELLQELGSYQYEMSAAGQVRYSAPEGDHDDCVISLALAYWAAQHPAWAAEPFIAVEDNEVISPV